MPGEREVNLEFDIWILKLQFYGYILPMDRSSWALATLKSLNAP
jgi:hypothetical protein